MLIYTIDGKSNTQDTGMIYLDWLESSAHRIRSKCVHKMFQISPYPVSIFACTDWWHNGSENRVQKQDRSSR